MATDPSPHMLRRAAPKTASAAESIETRAADAQELPFPDGNFDAMVATLAFYTIPNPMQALEEIRRVANPGTPLLMSEHVHAKTRVKRLLLNLKSPVQQFIGEGYHPNLETVKTVSCSGLRVEEVRELVTLRNVLIRARALG